jgi:hypothetical protein
MTIQATAIILLLAGATASQAKAQEDPCAVMPPTKNAPAPRRFTVQAPKGWKTASKSAGLIASAVAPRSGSMWIRAEQTPRVPDRCLLASAAKLEEAGLWRKGPARRTNLPGKDAGTFWYVLGQDSPERSPCGKVGTPELVGLYQSGDTWYALNARLCSGDPVALALKVLKTFKTR